MTTKHFISGSYAREVSNEYSIGKDTLVITPVNAVVYAVIHKGTYSRIKNGKLLSPERKYENWTTSYDEDRQTLTESKRGRIISFDASKDILWVGSSRYKKIK
jgi:hypothetical protein